MADTGAFPVLGVARVGDLEPNENCRSPELGRPPFRERPSRCPTRKTSRRVMQVGSPIAPAVTHPRARLSRRRPIHVRTANICPKIACRKDASRWASCRDGLDCSGGKVVTKRGAALLLAALFSALVWLSLAIIIYLALQPRRAGSQPAFNVSLAEPSPGSR